MGFPKLLLCSNGKLVIEQVVSRLSAAGWKPIGLAVSDDRFTDLIHEKLPNVDIIFNQQPDKGMISSIRLGLDWAGKEAAGLLTLPVDHPFVGIETLRGIRSRADSEKIVAPVHKDRRGHPTWWGRKSWNLLKAPIAEDGARAVLRAQEVDVIELRVDDEGVLLNVNTPEDAAKYNLERYRIEGD